MLVSEAGAGAGAVGAAWVGAAWVGAAAAVAVTTPKHKPYYPLPRGTIVFDPAHARFGDQILGVWI
jgi:hypothetical protein